MVEVATSKPILYSFRRCPYAMRARLALQVAGIQCHLREIVLRDKAPALLRASPKGTVPVLVLPNGEILDESLCIALWALSQNDPQAWLSPASGSREEMQVLIDRTEPEFKRHLDRYKYASRHDDGDGYKHRDLAMPFLLELNERLQRGWLFGSSQCWADAAIAPFVRQYSHTNRDWFAAQPLPRLQTWLNRFVASSSFARVMMKYPMWQEQDKARDFPEARAVN